MSAKVYYMSDYRKEDIRYAKMIKAMGLRAWRVNKNIWICSVSFGGKLVWFISKKGIESQFITRAEAQTYLVGM